MSQTNQDGAAADPVSPPLQDMLEAILRLEAEAGGARVRDLAAALKIHKSTVTATLAGVSGSGTCAAASGNGLFLSAATNNGTAVIPLTAPSTPGTYTITPNGSVTGAFPAVTITVQATTTTAGPTTTVGPTTTGVPADDLPETGSSTGPTVMIAAVLLLAGIGMFAVAQVRRRQAETPA